MSANNAMSSQTLTFQSSEVMVLPKLARAEIVGKMLW